MRKRRTPLPESKDVTFEAVALLTDRLGYGLESHLETVIKDLEFRAELGEAKYGTRLHTFNGRDPLIDLYEELLDALVYAVQYSLESNDGYAYEAVDSVIASICTVADAIQRRMTAKGFLRGRAPQPAPLFDRPIEQYL